jgi:hypothetical protein
MTASSGSEHRNAVELREILPNGTGVRIGARAPQNLAQDDTSEVCCNANYCTPPAPPRVIHVGINMTRRGV